MTIERECNTHLEHNFTISFIELLILSVNNENFGSGKQEYRQLAKNKNIQISKRLKNKDKRTIYKLMVQRFKSAALKQYWIGITLTLYPDIEKEYISHLPQNAFLSIDVEFTFSINIKLSDNSLKKLKLIDMELYDMLYHRSEHDFKKLFPYRSYRS